METRFQTSFIPKKPLPTVGGAAGGIGQTPGAPRASHRTNSLFLTIASLLFIISIGAAGGVYAWKSLVISNQENYKSQLVQKQRQFNPDLIEELMRANVKIDTAQNLLVNHLAVSQIFNIIGRLTIESVRFLSMDLTSVPGQGVKVTMRGYGTSFSSVAFQSDVLGSLEQYGLRKIVKNPILSDPALDTSGTVAFGFSAEINPDNLSYIQSLETTPSDGNVDVNTDMTQ